ncbi:glycosyltransferase [Flaviaesturariibacter aridisoli]|uniref:Glycosyltransferase n=2 Tax=Flaviaesturariibacter aridisoli TaxID=2545761 RepID=A0A4R4DXJ1_9BACT|nr:glycosyltransferase [Flaviaesturariibacter aridisoli]TCZ63752.1 glycosyltransferase [Flaviaesturariibacter aridisoli]TCZ67745.1 glycosyltransferase [Flaviaesturariibacter aridisoli]
MLMSWGLALFVAFCVVAAIQLYYYLYFFRRVGTWKPRDREVSRQHPVSVIICARDEDENLVRHLPGVLLQQYPSTREVVVVNDNSLDDTRYVLEDFQKTYKDLHIVELQQEAKLIAGKKYPLSVGIKEAKHELLLLTDADCVPASEHWIYRMQDAFDDGIEVVLGYGAYHRQKGFLNKAIRFETFHTALQYFGYALAGRPYMGVGRNLAYRKGTFFRHKGFSSINHIPSGDDDLFINKVATKDNTAVVIDPEAFTLSRPKQSWKEWRRQKNRHYSTGKYYKPAIKWLLGLYTLSFVLFYPLLAASLVLFDWRWPLIPLALRWISIGVVWSKGMKKLGEKDLFAGFIFWDIWQFFYYILFAPAVWKKPKKMSW